MQMQSNVDTIGLYPGFESQSLQRLPTFSLWFITLMGDVATEYQKRAETKNKKAYFEFQQGV